jgi:phosphatidylserine decarboxylase
MGLIAREGLYISTIPGALTVFAFFVGGPVPGIAGVVVTLAIALFFRDPERTVDLKEGEIVCPADGRVVAVEDGSSPRSIPDGGFRVSVFMSVFNVHVNRIPVDGKVLGVYHTPGGFSMAHLDEAMANNERTEVLLEDGSQRRFLLVQVAGMVARRIICRLKEGDTVMAGQRFGLICFGSRVDLYLPPGFEPLVNPGQRVRAGVTILAVMK